MSEARRDRKYEQTNQKHSNQSCNKKKKPFNKSPGPDGFTGEVYQMFNKDLMPILLKLLQKIGDGGTYPNSFYRAMITLIPKPDKDNTKRKLQANIIAEQRCKIPQKNSSK